MTSIFIKNYAIFYSSNLNRWYTKFSSLLLQLLWHESSEDCLFNQTIQVSKYYEKKKKLLCWRKNIYSLSQFFHSKWVTRFAYQQRMFQVQAKLWADSGRIRYWQSCIYEKLWLTCTCYKNGSPQMAISNSATSFNWHIARPTWYFCAICVR